MDWLGKWISEVWVWIQTAGGLLLPLFSEFYRAAGPAGEYFVLAGAALLCLIGLVLMTGRSRSARSAHRATFDARDRQAVSATTATEIKKAEWTRKDCIQLCRDEYNSQIRYLKENYGPGTYDYDHGKTRPYEEGKEKAEAKLTRCLQNCDVQYPAKPATTKKSGWTREDCIKACRDEHNSQMRYLKENYGPGTYDYDHGKTQKYDEGKEKAETKLNQCLQNCRVEYPE